MGGSKRISQRTTPKILVVIVLLGFICSGVALAADTGQEKATVSSNGVLNATTEKSQVMTGMRTADIVALDSNSSVDWEFGSDEISAVTSVNETAVVSTIIGTSETRSISAIDIETGTHKWTHNITGIHGNIQSIEGGDQTAFISVDNQIYALDIETGERQWRKDAFGTPRLTYRGETLYAHSEGSVRAFYTNGTEKWETETGSSPVSGAPDASAPIVSTESVAILTACESNQSEAVLCYTAFGRENGELQSHFITNTEATDGGISEPVRRDGTVFVTAGHEFTRADAKAVAIDVENASLVEFASVKTGSRIAVGEANIFVTTDNGVTAYNRDGYGEAWNAPGSTPTQANGQILAVVNDEVRSYNPQTGQPRINATPRSGTPLAKAIIPTGEAILVQSEGWPSEPGVFALEREYFQSPIRVTPSEPTTDRSVTVSAPTIDASSYEWDFTGDNTTDARGQQVSHTFDTSGEKTARLTATSNGERETYTRTFLVREPLKTTLTIGSQYPKPDSFVTLNASESSGTGTLQYEWVVNGDELYCSDPVCTIEVGEETTNVSVTVRDEQGQTETRTQTIQPTAITLDTSIDNTSSTSYIFDKTLLPTESAQIRVDDSQISADTQITNVSIDGPATVEGVDPVKLTPTGVGTATVDIEIKSEASADPITRSTEFTLVEFSQTDGRFSYKFEVENRTAKTMFARFQTQLQQGDNRYTATFTAQQVKQRLDGLPEEIQVVGGDPDADIFDEYSGYAVPPNEVLLSPSLTQGAPFKFHTAQETLRHELTHLAQYKLDMETDGEWNFLLEGHAVYEASTSPKLIRSKPPKSSLLNWNGTLSEYHQAGGFVSAFMAEYGRQTFLELVRDSEGTDLQTQFEQTTGESFESFYDRWLSGEANDPARKRGSLPHVTFYYEDAHLVADAAGDLTTATWDVDSDGVDELTGKRVSWTPKKNGEQKITLTLDNGEHTLSQKQIIEVDSTAKEPLAPAVAGSDGVITTGEALQAVEAWRMNDRVAGTSQVPSTTQILTIVEYWRTGEKVS